MFLGDGGIYGKYSTMWLCLCNACKHAQLVIQVLYTIPGGTAGFQKFDIGLFFFQDVFKQSGIVFSGGLDPAADSKVSSETLCKKWPQLHPFQWPKVVKHVVYCK